MVLTRREKGAGFMTTATDTTVARLAAEAAVERAKMDLLAPILAFTNQLAFDLRVSTNYISPFGFDPNPLPNADPRTNVNYAYANRDRDPARHGRLRAAHGQPLLQRAPAGLRENQPDSTARVPLLPRPEPQRALRHERFLAGD